ncbi:P-type cation-transporting ATPase [Cyphellophora attinorum]|uniref:P-type cation-transporting ATPase n=1 Tax=Cyphellophora attinorum TaxID=1664694 RepID=A0A0N0NLZ6_9EURO|nr:P-type cation-transporting ATPase [Phialophora attinorum]KPI39758.1 P-type cation-transporting ATPase [Phialophora attinorum]
MPHGVEGCEPTGKGRFAVAYDPCLIGARKVLAASGGELLPANHSRLDDGKRILIDKAVKTGLAFLLTIPVLVLTWGEDDIGTSKASLSVCFVLATLVQSIAYPEFYRPAISSLVYNRVIEMDMLVVISISAAYGYSVVAFGIELSGQLLETGTLFETSTLLIALVLLGRLLASWARKRAITAVSLGSLQVSMAKLASGEEIDARLLHVGDLIKLQPHTKIVTDAIIQEGAGEVDESILTGESLPVQKSIGDSVIAGTLNGSTLLNARVSRLPGKNTINDIENLVNQAQNARPKTQELANRIAGYFVPVIVFVAVVVAITWAIVAVKVRNRSANVAAGLSISYAIAVLAISCPCALGLAVPMVLVVAGGVAARGGVIIKSAEVTERGHKVTDVIFDKTGTLTEGNLEVVHQDVRMENVLGVIQAMVSDNQHPVSRAIADSITDTASTDVHNVVSSPGAGIEADWHGQHVKAGKAECWASTSNPP